MEFGCIKRRGQRLKIVVFPSKTVTLWREVWSASLSHEQSFFDTRCWGCVFFQGASGFHISDSCNKGSSLPKHNPHHWLCTYGGRRGCQQDIWWASGKNTCALEKKRKARRPRRVRLGLRPGPRHCHRLPLRRGWEQFLDLIPNSWEKQVIMATIRGLWVFFFYRESMFGQLLIIPSSLTTGIQVYFEKKPAGKTSFSLRIFLFYSYFCFLPEFFISALTGGYWKTKLTNWFHIRSITQRVTKTNYNWLNCGVPDVRFTA